MRIKNLFWRIIERLTRFAMARSGTYFRLRLVEKKLEFLETTLSAENYTEALVRFVGYMKCIKSSNYAFTRVGSANDGGYLLLDTFSNVGVCISLGIGANVEFEQALLAKGIPVVAVDGTIPSYPNKPHSKLIWVNKNVGAIDNANLVSLNSIFLESDKQFAWTGDCLLKIDIEGHEYETIQALDMDFQVRASQIILELHNVLPKLYHSPLEIFSLVEKLLKTHELVHIHGNNYEYAINTNGSTIPNVLELTFARKDFVSSSFDVAKFPRVLDAPNNPYLPDIIINLQ